MTIHHKSAPPFSGLATLQQARSVHIPFNDPPYLLYFFPTSLATLTRNDFQQLLSNQIHFYQLAIKLVAISSDPLESQLVLASQLHLNGSILLIWDENGSISYQYHVQGPLKLTLRNFIYVDKMRIAHVLNLENTTKHKLVECLLQQIEKINYTRII